MTIDNDGIGMVSRYFPDLTQEQLTAFGRLGELYGLWNAKINVVSRADIGHLYTRHVLHSLAIAKFLGPLAPGTRIMDLGTGGGFPGIPLAIAYPQCSFHLIDRIGKKINVARAVAQETGLTNISFQHGDSGECRTKFDYIVSRAVMALPELIKACAKNVDTTSVKPNIIHPGIVCLKGGDLRLEIADSKRKVTETDISAFFDDVFFETKKIIYVPFR